MKILLPFYPIIKNFLSTVNFLNRRFRSDSAAMLQARSSFATDIYRNSKTNNIFEICSMRMSIPYKFGAKTVAHIVG